MRAKALTASRTRWCCFLCIWNEEGSP